MKPLLLILNNGEVVIFVLKELLKLEIELINKINLTFVKQDLFNVPNVHVLKELNSKILVQLHH